MWPDIVSVGHTASLACLQDAFKPLHRLSFCGFKRTPTAITLVKVGNDMSVMTILSLNLSFSLSTHTPLRKELLEMPH